MMENQLRPLAVVQMRQDFRRTRLGEVCGVFGDKGGEVQRAVERPRVAALQPLFGLGRRVAALDALLCKLRQGWRCGAFDLPFKVLLGHGGDADGLLGLMRRHTGITGGFGAPQLRAGARL